MQGDSQEGGHSLTPFDDLDLDHNPSIRANSFLSQTNPAGYTHDQGEYTAQWAHNNIYGQRPYVFQRSHRVHFGWHWLWQPKRTFPCKNKGEFKTSSTQCWDLTHAFKGSGKRRDRTWGSSAPRRCAKYSQPKDVGWWVAIKYNSIKR